MPSGRGTGMRDPGFEMGRWVKSIDEALLLRHGWDSYDAAPPNAKSAEIARDFLSALEELDFHPAAVVPSVEGGMAVCFVDRGRVAQVEFFNDGDVVAVMYSDEDDPIVWELESERAEFLRAAKRIRVYIGSEAA